ncbi:MAG: right-handed parallel beta-helix repeat-containing protein [Deltaproteobacteria bacterium]|nr:right-handed parallel beta-helix repeat-containing protein [Deltaproteobacteria bacterium]
MLGACPGASTGAPEPTGIEPASIEQGFAVEVAIRGRGFAPKVLVSYQDPAGSYVMAGFGARLGEFELQQIAYVDSGTLTALVPATLPVGDYDLVVTAPSGLSGSLPQAFTVFPHTVQVDDGSATGDRPIRDGGAIDGASLDVPRLDAAQLDAPVADGPNADASASDGALPDTAASDGALPDTAASDSAFLDVTVADVAGPDATLSDRTGPDSGTSLNTPPIAVASVSPGAGSTAVLFEADGSGSRDREQAAATLAYRWDWENDGTFDAAGVFASHIFSAPGDYQVVLEVEDREGLVAYAAFLVVVVAAGPDLLDVSTAVDEADAGATPQTPGGSGFSLREAIAYANATAGHQVILVPPGTTAAIDTALPDLSDNAGATIVGDGATIDGAAAGGSGCVGVASSDNRILGLEIFNCSSAPISVAAGTSGNQVARCFLHDNDWTVVLNGSGNTFGPDNELIPGSRSFGIYLQGPNTVVGNRIHGPSTSTAISIATGGAGSRIVGNFLCDNTMGVQFETQANSCQIWHNTVHGNTSSGFKIAANVTGTDLRNNIVAGNGGWGIDGKDSNLLLVDFNDVTANVDGQCRACSALGVNGLDIDPGFVDTATGDLRLGPTSPLIDRGTDLGIDVNGPAPGLFEPSAPDIGAFEFP